MKMQLNRFLTASIFYIFANSLGQGIILFSSIIFTRIMSQEHYGLYVNYYSVVALFTPFVGANLFIGLNIGYFDFREKRNEFRASLTLLSLIIFIIFSSIVILSAFLIKYFFNQTFSLFMLLFALMHAYSFFIINFYNSYVNMENRYKIKSLLLILPNILQVCLSLLFIYTIRQNTYKERVWGSSLGVFICAFILFFIMLSQNRNLINKQYFTYALKISVPSILSSIAYMVMQQSDHLMITKYVGAEKTAVYGLVYTIGNILYAFLQATSGAFQAWIYRMLNSKNFLIIKRIQKWYLYFFIILTFGLLMIAPELIKLLSPASYWDFRYIPPFIAGSSMIIINNFYATIGEFYKKTGIISLCVAGAALCNIILNIYAIQKFGAHAAAYTSFIACGGLVLFDRFFLIRKIKAYIYSDMYFLAFFLIVISGCIIFNFVLSYLSLRYIVFMAIILFLMIYAFLKRKEFVDLVIK